jgi:hypothetical protein
MCFSAGASFAGGIVISAIGVATGRQVKKPQQRLFASIPLLFGFQQMAEGVLWVTLKSGGYERLQDLATYIFLVTALVIWPVMIPLSLWLMEEVKARKQILAGLMAAGTVLAVYYIYALTAFDVYPRINNFHIQYIDQFPLRFVDLAFGLYILSTIVPLFVSSIRRMWIFGVLIALSFLVTAVFFSYYLTSVWCFFAASISMAIYWILNESHSKAGQLNRAFQG